MNSRIAENTRLALATSIKGHGYQCENLSHPCYVWASNQYPLDQAHLSEVSRMLILYSDNRNPPPVWGDSSLRPLHGCFWHYLPKRSCWWPYLPSAPDIPWLCKRYLNLLRRGNEWSQQDTGTAFSVCCSADVFENSSRGWNPVTVFFHSESVSLLQLHKPGFLPGRLVQLACGGFALSSHRGWNRRLLLGSLAFIAGYCISDSIHDPCYSLVADSGNLSRQQNILSLSSPEE